MLSDKNALMIFFKIFFLKTFVTMIQQNLSEVNRRGGKTEILISFFSLYFDLKLL